MQKFNYHSHTFRCGHADFDFTDEEYLLDYIKMGFKKIAYTDHCPEKNLIDIRTNMRMKYNERNNYLESIRKLKDKYSDKIEIESGYEVEYLPGEEENLRELKEETDKIILGQHFIYDNNKELKVFGKATFTDEELNRYAEYVCESMKFNIPDIIAHPDIFMLGRKSFGKIENEVANIICSTAEKYDIPLEINLNNVFFHTYYENKKLNNYSKEQQRLNLTKVDYPCKDFWKIASNYNIRVLYGIDAHHRGQILLWNELTELANEVIGNEIIEKLNFVEEDI